MLTFNTMPNLKDIIDEIMIEASTSTSIFRNAEKFMVDKYAKEGIKKLNLTFARSIKGMNVNVPISCKVGLAPDYLQFIRAYVINCDGRTIELKRNNNIPESIFHFLTDCDGTILLECDTTPLTDDCLVCNDVNYTGRIQDCTLCCGTGRSIPSALEEFLNEVNAFRNSWVAVHENSIEFSSDLEGMAVVIEYMSNSVNELSQCKINVPEELGECLEYYIKYKVLEGDQNMMNVSDRYKREYKRMRDKVQTDTNGFNEIDLKALFLMN